MRGKYSDFKKLARVMEHGLIENNEGESMEANDLSHNFADQSGSTCIV